MAKQYKLLHTQIGKSGTYSVGSEIKALEDEVNRLTEQGFYIEFQTAIGDELITTLCRHTKDASLRDHNQETEKARRIANARTALSSFDDIREIGKD